MAVGSSERILFCLWRDRTTLHGVAKLEQEGMAFARGHSNDCALVTIIETGAKMPEPGAREALARALKALGGTVVISGVAFEGDGFFAASVRAVVVGLTVLARQPFPHRVFGTVGEIAEWFESKQVELGVALPAALTLSEECEFRRLLHVAIAESSRAGSDSRLRVGR